MKIRIWPYKFHSEGARNLQLALQGAGLDCLRVRTDGRYRPRVNHLIINWGNSNISPWLASAACRNALSNITGNFNILNNTQAVAKASNKLETFRILNEAGVNIPGVTTSKEVAADTLQQGLASKIYCRKQLTGHAGSGIVVAKTVEELVDAPLYTVGIDVKGEYRVHVFRNLNGEYKVIDIQKKRRRNEALENETLSMDVRNLAGGWVFAHNSVALEDRALATASDAVKALGLDFGAVDLVIEKRTERPVVLEVNSAPGISSPTTLNAYVEAIKCYLI